MNVILPNFIALLLIRILIKSDGSHPHMISVLVKFGLQVSLLIGNYIYQYSLSFCYLFFLFPFFKFQVSRGQENLFHLG